MKKIVLFVLIGVVLFAVIYAGVSLINNATGPAPVAATQAPERTTATTAGGADTGVVRISLDEWIGWKSLIDANGGLRTAKGSIYDQLGLDIEFVIINDPATSSADLLSGRLAGAGYTVNRYAFLQARFDEAGVPVVMPFITNYSNGGDGIIANADIRSVNDLVNAKIAVPRFSEAHTLVEWLLRNAGLSEREQAQVRASMVFFETAEDTGKAFFSGAVDAAATWEPFLTQARTSTDAHVLFDTSMSTNLILDGIVFRQAFVEEHPAFATKLIEGALLAAPLYQTEFRYIKSFPMFEFETEEGIIEMTRGAKLTTWADNAELLIDTAQAVYASMADIWISLGEQAFPGQAASAFTDAYLPAYQDAFAVRDTTDLFASADKGSVLRSGDRAALMSLSLDIRFEVDSVQISADSYPVLNEFAQVAKILNGVFIQIEGNTAAVDGSDGVDFSYRRALSVAKYLQLFGVDAKRIIVVGNGDGKPIATNATEEGRAANRRTEIFFKTVDGY